MLSTYQQSISDTLSHSHRIHVPTFVCIPMMTPSHLTNIIIQQYLNECISAEPFIVSHLTYTSFMYLANLPVLYLYSLSAIKHVFADMKMIPIENHKVRCMSIGFLVEKDAPIVWRGPMVCCSIWQLFCALLCFLCPYGSWQTFEPYGPYVLIQHELLSSWWNNINKI